MSATTVTVENNIRALGHHQELPRHVVKVFSATMLKQREELGTIVSDWLASQHGKIAVDHFVVSQSSDSEFHCISITVFAHEIATGKKS